jgi:hypothetical protein
VYRHRLTAQLLAGPPAPDPVTVVERLLAVQGQDPRGLRLAIRARTSGLTAADVDRALTVDRSLVVTWLNRGTLHLVRSEDYPWLHGLLTPSLFTGNARRLAQEGVSTQAAERAISVIERVLAAEGPLTRAQLGDRLEVAGLVTKGQALVHMLMLANLRGLIVRGPMVGTHQAYVLVRDWLPEPEPFDADAALAELARRYLVGHGPADDRDLAQWSGLPLRDARAGLKAMVRELQTRPDGLTDVIERGDPAELPPPRLLGAFDPLLLGWRSRASVIGSHQGIVTVNGLFRPFALVEGRAVGTWTMANGSVVLEPFDELTPDVAAALAADAEDVARFLGAA